MQNYQTQDGFTGVTLTMVGILALAAGLLLGYYYGAGSFDAAPMLGTTEEERRATEADMNTTTTNTTLTEDEKRQPAFTVVVADLPEAQQTALRSMGFDTPEIVITRGTVACAETSIGNDRMTEIQNGATPNPVESVTLVGCYTANQ